jgi:hypothetical protein
MSASATQLVRAIRRRHQFLALMGSPQAAAILDILEAEFASSVRFHRVGNPLAAALTINRIVLQLGGDFANSPGEEAENLVSTLMGNDAGMAQTLLIIEQAQTLDNAALRSLSKLPTLGRPGSSFIQILFVAENGCLDLPEGEDLTELRQQLVDCSAVEQSRGPWTAPRDAWTILFSPRSTAPSDHPAPQQDLAPGMEAAEIEGVNSPVAEQGGSRGLRAPLMFAAVVEAVLIAVALDVVGTASSRHQSEEAVILSPPRAHSRPTPPVVSQSAAAGPVQQQTSVPPSVAPDRGLQTAIEPATTAVPAPVMTEVPPGSNATISMSNDDRLRDEFDLFLSRFRPDLVGLTAVQRETLVTQYVARHSLR